MSRPTLRYKIPNKPKGAVLSPKRTYRYLLWRWWGHPYEVAEDDMCAFIGYNPSTADADDEDNTSRRFGGFARGFEFDGYVAANMYGYRATDPKDLRKQIKKGGDHAEGPFNIHWLRWIAINIPCIIACWGGNVDPQHAAEVVQLIYPLMVEAQGGGADLRCLGKTNKGEPRHPLYLPKNAKLERLDAVSYMLERGVGW